jgi:hypothetical protein
MAKDEYVWFMPKIWLPHLKYKPNTKLYHKLWLTTNVASTNLRRGNLWLATKQALGVRYHSHGLAIYGLTRADIIK